MPPVRAGEGTEEADIGDSFAAKVGNMRGERVVRVEFDPQEGGVFSKRNKQAVEVDFRVIFRLMRVGRE